MSDGREAPLGGATLMTEPGPVNFSIDEIENKSVFDWFYIFKTGACPQRLEKAASRLLQKVVQVVSTRQTVFRGSARTLLIRSVAGWLARLVLVRLVLVRLALVGLALAG